MSTKTRPPRGERKLFRGDDMTDIMSLEEASLALDSRESGRR
jgi:hypothetical protein